MTAVPVTTVPATVLVTPRSFGRDDPELCRALDAAVSRVRWEQGEHTPQELARLVGEADGWIAGVEPIGPTVLSHARRLRVIARYGVGVDNVDVDLASRRGITVTNTPGANAGAVAELVVGLLIALARRIPAADRAVRDGEWTPSGGVSLQGKVLGLLGFGAIGRAVAERVSGFGMEILVHDPRLTTDPPLTTTRTDTTVRLTDRDQVVSRADFLSLHVPLTPSTRGMVDASFLSRMKPGAYLVNAARGGIVDESALAAALRSGRLAGAALDALATEPPLPGFDLARLDSVILTPHIGAQTDHARRMMARQAIDNCLAVLRGERPPDPVTSTGGATA